jgi:quinoprotein glucose dehydrogenase
MSLDEERGIVFVPTGSVADDFYGGKRLGSTLFGNCLIALEASNRKTHLAFSNSSP